MAESVIVIDVSPPSGLELPADGDVVLFPDDLVDDRGAYPMTAAALADDLVKANLAVRTWHDPEHTDWYADRDGVLAAIILGIVSNAAWDTIKGFLSRRGDASVDVTIGYRADGTVRWVRAKGRAEDVSNVLDKMHGES